MAKVMASDGVSASSTTSAQVMSYVQAAIHYSKAIWRALNSAAAQIGSISVAGLEIRKGRSCQTDPLFCLYRVNCLLVARW